MTIESSNNKFQCWKCRQDREVIFTSVTDKDGKTIKFCHSKCFNVYKAIMDIKESEASKKYGMKIVVVKK